MLLEQDVELEAKDKLSWTPLIWAAVNGHEAAVKLLLKQGAKLNARDNYGQTPLSRAVEKGYKAVAKLLENWP